MASRSASGAGASTAQVPGEAEPLAVHLLSGLPSPGDEATFARLRESLRILDLAEAPDPDLLLAKDVGIRLPPHAEPGGIVESWENGAFLSDLSGRPASRAW